MDFSRSLLAPLAYAMDKRLPLQEMSPFGPAIKKLRDDADMGQRDLAEKIGIDPQQVSKLERGIHAPSRSTRKKLAAAFNMTVEALEAFVANFVETVPIDIPRDLYDRAATRAGEQSPPVEVADWIVDLVRDATGDEVVQVDHKVIEEARANRGGRAAASPRKPARRK